MQIKTILSGSPHENGTTFYIIKNLFPEYKNIIQLSKKKINPCIDCDICNIEKCKFKDDFENILNELDNTFVLISPIYFCNFPSFVKCFIDRFQYYFRNNINLNFENSIIILHGERGNYKAEEGLRFVSEIIFKILGSNKNYFEILHKFNINNKNECERKILWMKEKLKIVFFVK